MAVKSIYRVRVWAKGGVYSGKTLARSYREIVVTSMRAAIALTWGLECDWEVLRDWGTNNWAFIGNEEYISPSDVVFAKTWNHNSRAFKQTLRPTMLVQTAFDACELAVWDNTDTMDV